MKTMSQQSIRLQESERSDRIDVFSRNNHEEVKVQPKPKLESDETNKV